MDSMDKLIPVSNIIDEDENGNPIYGDRIYQDLHKHIELVQKDGTTYNGKINTKRRPIFIYADQKYYVFIQYYIFCKLFFGLK